MRRLRSVLACATLAACLPACVDDGREDLAILRVTPSVGSLAGGTTITVEGEGFDGDTVVQFFFPLESPPVTVTLAPPVVVSSRTLLAVTPVLPPPPFSSVLADVVVRQGSRTAVKAQAFTYQSVAPTVASVNPAVGPVTGGTLVTISGTGFLTGATVEIGGVPAASPTVVDPNTILATTPVHGAGGAVVQVFNPDGKNSGTSVSFTYVGPPAPTAIAPTGGPTIGGTRVTITGTGFQAGAAVTIAGAACSDVLVSSGSIICTAPALPGAGSTAFPPSVQNVVVTNSDTQSGTLSSAYTYRTTRTYVSHAGTPNTVMVLNYADGASPTLTTAFGTPAGTGGNGGAALATYTDPGLTSGVDAVLYVANQTSSTVSVFTVSSTGTVSAVGSPVGVGTGAVGPALLRVHPDGSGGYLLYALCANGYLSTFAITTSTGALGTASPVQLTTTAGSAPFDWVVSGSVLYVSDPGANEIHVVDLSIPTAPSPGSVTAVANRDPTILHVFPGGQYIFASNTGSAGGNVDSYQVSPGPSLSALSGGPFTTGSVPLGMADDGANLFVANSGSGTISPFSVSNGSLTATSAVSAGTGPALLQVRAPHLYALNLGSNDISGFTIGVGGALTGLSGNPFGTGASAAVTWVWGADRLFVLDGGAVRHLARTAATGALSTVAGTNTGGSNAADLLLSR